MTCKLGFAVCLVLAQQDFVKNKGLVLILLTSLLANIVVSFLQALVPGFLVSITDAIAAIVVLILAVVWGLFFLIGSIPAIFKLALSVKNAGSAAASAVQ
jgi:VanZ family protein